MGREFLFEDLDEEYRSLLPGELTYTDAAYVLVEAERLLIRHRPYESQRWREVIDYCFRGIPDGIHSKFIHSGGGIGLMIALFGMIGLRGAFKTAEFSIGTVLLSSAATIVPGLIFLCFFVTVCVLYFKISQVSAALRRSRGTLANN